MREICRESEDGWANKVAVPDGDSRSPRPLRSHVSALHKPFTID
jgi:hypothetical protein